MRSKLQAKATWKKCSLRYHANTVGLRALLATSHMKRTARIEGDLMYLEIFGKRTLIVNSQKVARDLLDKRGAKYSSRPRMVTFVELCVTRPLTFVASR